MNADKFSAHMNPEECKLLMAGACPEPAWTIPGFARLALDLPPVGLPPACSAICRAFPRLPGSLPRAASPAPATCRDLPRRPGSLPGFAPPARQPAGICPAGPAAFRDLPHLPGRLPGLPGTFVLFLTVPDYPG